MTTLKVNVIRRPQIKVKVLPTFPASVTVTSPILLSRTGGNYAFSFDANSLLTTYQPFDPGLSALAALDSTAGLLTETAQDTFARRTLAAPAAGLTITNPAGTAGNPTFALANDLAAVEGLSSTGIARRTGTDAWSVGTAVTNAELATMAAWTFKVNNTSGSATPTDITIDGLTLKASPATGDEVILWDVAGAAIKKATVLSIGSSSGVSSIAGNTGAFTLAYPLGNVVNDIRYVGPTDSGQLTFTSTAALAFKPYKGDTIKINGVVMQIPSAGIAGLGAPTSVFLNGVAAQTLVAATTYYIYAFSNAGTVTADFSTTGHSPSATAGNIGTEIKTGDDTRSLIGMVRTGATVIYASDLQTASWFNRRNKTANATFTSGAGSAGTVNFVTWAEESYSIGVSGTGTQTTLNANVTLNLQIDGGSVGSGNGGTTSVATGNVSVSNHLALSSAEGNHVLTILIAVNSGTTSTAGTSYVMVRG